MSLIFDLIYLILSVFYLPALIFKGRHKAGFGQRFGIYPDHIKQRLIKEKFTVWLHAVSVGEIKAAIPLIKHLKKDNPKIKLLISTITPTGNKVACDIAQKEDLVIYFPFDLSWIVKKVFLLAAPRLLLIMETELWPNSIKIASKQGIKIVIANGRISDKAFPNYRRAEFMFKPIIKKIDLLLMQTDADAKRVLQLGANKESVHVVGNMKFDQVPELKNKSMPAIGLGKQESLLVAGSTHDNEEEQIALVYKKLKQKHKDLRLLIAPRHPHRVEQIIDVLSAMGLSCIKISQIINGQKKPAKDDVFILDIMGVLTDYYRLADIVFIGGSLIEHGGQNPIEAAVLSKPVIFGPHMFNFKQVAKLFLDNQAAVCVKNKEELQASVDKLLSDNKIRSELVENADKIIKQNKGSVIRIMKLISSLM
jgi:3-deoxy-D-manno-octulosonic-acid transferase